MYQLISYLSYWLKRSEAHGLHAPFVFDLYTKVISNKKNLNPQIEDLRHELKKKSSIVSLEGFDASSPITKPSKRSIKDIANNDSKPPQFSAMLGALVDYLGFSNILELGTSLGFTSLYLTQNPQVALSTFEKDPILADYAQENFARFHRKNIQIIKGHFDETLPVYLARAPLIDLAYIATNHRFASALYYYEQMYKKLQPKGMIIIDDIHWSKEMHAAWCNIKQRPEVKLSIDLFEAGILCFDSSLEKQEYVLTF